MSNGWGHTGPCQPGCTCMMNTPSAPNPCGTTHYQGCACNEARHAAELRDAYATLKDACATLKSAAEMFREERDQARTELARIREALEGLIDPNPCMTDHNLFCQEHGSSYPCVNRIALQALAESQFGNFETGPLKNTELQCSSPVAHVYDSMGECRERDCPVHKPSQ